MALVGLTSAQAVRKPASSSQANRALARCVVARHAGVLRVAQNGRAQFLRPAQPLQLANADERCSSAVGWRS